MVAHEWVSDLCYYAIVRSMGVLGLRWVQACLTLCILAARGESLFSSAGGDHHAAHRARG
jgi:hypothetical protein